MHHTSRVAVVLPALLIAWNAFSAAPPAHPASQQEYWAQVDRRDWPQAVKAAEALVAQAREDSATAPLKLADALSLLGDAQLGAADYVSAETSFNEALQLAEKNAGVSSAALVAPLRGLGYAHAATGKHAQAVPYLDRALLIARRNFGLFDTAQQDLLRTLAASLTKLERGAEAERHLIYSLRIGERVHGKGDVRNAPLMCHLAEWYANVGQFESSRALYRAALAMIDKQLGRNHIAAVEPLRGLASAFTQELFYSTLGLQTDRQKTPTDADGTSNEHKAQNPRYLDQDGEKALERALKIIESQPTPPRELYIETLVQLADWRQIKHQPERALPLYRRAAAVIGAGQPPEAAPAAPAAGGGAERVGLILSFPVRVYYPTPWLATRNRTLSTTQVNETFVQVEFTVTKNGDVSNARVMDENATERQVDESLEAIRAARFRPRFIDGEPVDTPGVTSREVFKVRKTSEDS